MLHPYYSETKNVSMIHCPWCRKFVWDAEQIDETEEGYKIEVCPNCNNKIVVAERIEYTVRPFEEEAE